jgi:hypothetical protein
MEYPLTGRVEVAPRTEAWTRSKDPTVCRGEPRSVPPGTYDVVSELREVAVVTDADRLDAGHVAEKFFVIAVDGDPVVVRSRDVSDATA